MKISRRGLLSGAAAASAAGGANRLLSGCSQANPGSPSPPASAELRTLQVGLPPAFVASAGFKVQLNSGGSVYDLKPHTDATRAQARADNPYLRALPDSDITDFAADIAFPSDAPQLFSMTYERYGSDPSDVRRGLLLCGINIPRAAILEAEQITGGDFNLNPHRVRLARPHLLMGETVGEETADIVDWGDSARAFMAHHPEMLSLDPTTMALVMSIIADLPETRTLASVMQSIGELVGPDSPYAGWAEAVYSLDLDGSQIPRLDLDKKPILNEAGGIEYEYDFVPDPDVRAAAGVAIRKALRLVRDKSYMEGRKFYVAPGFHAVQNDQGPPDDGLTGDAGAPSGDASLAPFARRSDGVSAYSFAFDREGEWRYGQRVMRTSVVDRTIGMRVDNSYFRYIGLWTAFKDVDGNPMKLADVGVSRGGLDTEYCKYQGMVSMPPRIMGIPVVGVDTYREFAVSIPAQASKVAVLTGTVAFFDGDLRPEYAGVRVPGMAMTLAFCYGFPVLFLGVGAAGQIAQSAILGLVEAVGPAVIEVAVNKGFGLESGSQRGSLDSLGLAFVNTVTKKLVGGAAAMVAASISAAAAASFAKAAMPFVGWAWLAIDAAVTAVEIITTTVQIGLSRSCVDSTASFTHAIEVTIANDPLHPGAFPQTATRVVVSAVCSKAQTFVSDLPFSPANDPVPLTRMFASVPSGGNVKVTAVFLTDSGWIAGQGEVEVPNLVPDGKDKLSVAITIEERLVPLTTSTIYTHAKKLAVNGNQHTWLATTIAPNAALGDLDCRPLGGGLCTPTAITYSTMSGQLGYAYESSSPGISECGAASVPGVRVYLLTNINDSKTVGDGSPDAALSATSCGYRQPVLLSYDLKGLPNGNHFAAVPLPKGGYVARRITLAQATTFASLELAPIVGKFSSNRLTAIRYHTAGYLIGMNPDHDKIEILPVQGALFNLPSEAPVADIIVGTGASRGLVGGLVAVAPTYTGRSFLALEGRNKRLQALDDLGSPVPNYFAGTQGWMAPLKAEDGVTYLDMSVEATGYIYILSYVNAGTVVTDFRVDLYNPDGSWLARTQGMAAARLVVDLWRNVYTLNFEKIVVAGRTEPSVSQWIPSTP